MASVCEGNHPRLEIENPDFAKDEEERALRERRRQFYLRNGIVDTGVNIELAGVEYRIMEMLVGKPHTPDEIRGLLAGL